MKRVFTILLLLLTVVLAGAAIFAGYYLTQQNTAPEDSSAGETCNSSCNGDGDCSNGMRCKNNQCKFCLDSLCNNTTCDNPNPPPPPSQYATILFNIGGLPDQSVINQYTTCHEYNNPCDIAAGLDVGKDAYCFCPGYSPPTDVGCLYNNPDGTQHKENWGSPIRTVSGQSLGCAPGSITCYRCTTSQSDGNTCESSTITATSCPAGWSTNSNCAQNAGGSCPVVVQGLTCYRCTVGLNDGNACESQTVTTASCPAGWTTNSACEQEVEGDQCPREIEVVDCGDSCENSEQCGDAQTCDGGICKRDICLEDGACSDDSCTPVGCGDGNVDPGEECGEPGLSCPQGTRCVTASCSCESNSCGDPCSSDLECPNGHRCDTTRGNCVIELCLNNSNCTNNGCTLTPLPGTALLGKTEDRLLIGVLAILIGLIAIRFNAVNQFLEPLGRMESVYDLLPEGGVKYRLRGKKKEKFEDKFE